MDREIKTQIVQSCSSHKLRTKALESPSYTLTQLLDAGQAMELSETQAANIEDKQSVNKLSSSSGNRSRRGRNNNANSNQAVTKTVNQQSANIVAKITPILEEEHLARRMKPPVETVAS